MHSKKHEELSHADHLLVFLSLIFAYIIVEFLYKLSFIVKNMTTENIYMPFFVWFFIIFLLVVESWWGLYSSRRAISSNIINFISILLGPIFLYAVGMFLLPQITNVNIINLKKHFFENRVNFFISASLLISYLLLNSMWHQRKGFLCGENKLRMIGIAVLLSGVVVKAEWYHYILPWIGLPVLMFFILSYRYHPISVE